MEERDNNLLVSLVQYSNNLGDEGAAKLSSSLEQMTKLKMLDMVRWGVHYAENQFLKLNGLAAKLVLFFCYKV